MLGTVTTRLIIVGSRINYLPWNRVISMTTNNRLLQNWVISVARVLSLAVNLICAPAN